MLVAFPLNVAVGIRLRDAEDAVDAVGSGPLQRRVVRRQHVSVLVVQVRRHRSGRAVRYDRRRLRDGADGAAVGAVAVVTDRLGLLGRLVPHDPDKANKPTQTVRYFRFIHSAIHYSVLGLTVLNLT